MDVKVKNGLIKALTYILSLTGSVMIIVFQYATEEYQAPTAVKIAVPCLIALLIIFLVYYKSLKQKINRKLIAIETAKELGQPAKTNAVVANILEVIGIVVPLLLIATIFVVGGQYLGDTGKVLFELIGMFTITIIGNICCDYNTAQDIKKKEAEQAEALADKIAEKVKKIPKKYE